MIYKSIQSRQITAQSLHRQVLPKSFDAENKFQLNISCSYSCHNLFFECICVMRNLGLHRQPTITRHDIVIPPHSASKQTCSIYILWRSTIRPFFFFFFLFLNLIFGHLELDKVACGRVNVNEYSSLYDDV